ncbi:NnrS family protein [Antarctobacter sp.]|uniref:NnrS family protein n=1 Tax=Antarctobacter sp. TaxID=1872577 RepID=UPI002B2709EA|nr:NnrS family protein [Antarctobacter sp.]
MALSSAEQMRAWRGPALFSFGFRPFFLFGAIWAAFAMVLWIMALSGALDLPTRFDPVSWHAHEFLFGYLGAVLAGFLLTAVPNWTGRLPLVGWPLAALFALWGAGRVAVLISAFLPPGIAAGTDLAFPLVLGAVILREIVAGKNWRNLMVLGLLTIFTVANALFHLEAARGDYAAQGTGLRLGLATAIMMIGVIGGRIIPSFTRNWLVKEGRAARPTPPMQRFDKAVLLASVAGLLLWVLLPLEPITAVLLLAVGALHLMRLSRWQGQHTGAEPLVWVLHVAYAFIPMGAIALGLAGLTGTGTAAAQHLWMAGAIGSMTLAVMTRATLGHSGQPLLADRWTLAIYLSFFGSVTARFGADAVPVLIHVSGLLWLIAFGGFAVAYGRLLLRERTKG